MNASEMMEFRTVLAELGIEVAPSNLFDPERMEELDRLKKGFRRVADCVGALKPKVDFEVLSIKEAAAELELQFGFPVSENMCKHLLLMYRIFDYEGD